MAYTEAQYNALVAAIATGAKKVVYADKEVEYRTVGEMESLKREMEIDLGLTKKACRRTVGNYKKF